MATLTERQAIRDKHSDAWVAVEPGDTLIGKVMDVTEAWSDARTNAGKNPERGWYPLLTVGEISEATGYPDSVKELKVHAFGAVLYNEIMRLRPNVGDPIRITYTGTGEAKKRGQNPPELYAVRGGDPTVAAKRAYERIDAEGPGGASTRPNDTAPEAAADFDPNWSDSLQEDIPF